MQSVLIDGSETWPMKVDDMRLERTERLMVRWMCSVSLKDRILSKKLNSYLGVSSVRRGRLRWFDHLERTCESVWMIGCLLAEFLRCQVIRVEAGVGRRGENVLMVICACLV